MAFNSEEQLVYIAHAKRYLQDMVAQGKLSPIEYQRINKQLDLLNVEIAAKLPAQSLEGIVDALQDYAPKIDLAPFRMGLHQSRATEMILRRNSAILAHQDSFSIDDLHSGYSHIAIKPFNLNAVVQQYLGLCELVEKRDTSSQSIIGACEAFFNNRNRVHLAAGLPLISPDVVRLLVEDGVINSHQAIERNNDINELLRHIKIARDKITDKYLAGNIDPASFYLAGDYAYQLLCDQLLQLEGTPSPQLLRLVIGWPSFGKAELLVKLLQASKKDPDTLELIIACSGVDPVENPTQWFSWVQLNRDQDQLGLNRLNKHISENKKLYDLLFILSCQSILQNRLMEYWWPVLENYQRAQQEEIIAVEPHHHETESIEDVGETHYHDDRLILEDDIDHLEAVEAKLSHEDKIVNKVSAWNEYLKPFLSENWLGLIGIGFLLVAWLFLSMWLWNKGELYRIIAGVLPLALFTSASAWVTRFLANLPNPASRYTLSLTASLCVLSMPFNYMLAASLVELPSIFAKIVAIVLAVVYSFAIPGISRWIKDPFGYSPHQFLLQINNLIFLPFVVGAFLPNALTAVLSCVLFIGLLVLVIGLNLAKSSGAEHTSFSWKLLIVNSVIMLAILLIYFRFIPHPALLGIFLQCVAAVLLVYQHTSARSKIVSASVSLFGVLLSISHLVGLAISLVLATGYWALMVKYQNKNWPKEIFAAHFLLFSGVLSYALALPTIGNLLFFVFAYLLLIGYEAKACKHSIKLLSYLLPLFMLVTAYLSIIETAWVTWVMQALVVSGFVYAYWRSVHWYSVKLWYVNNLLFFLLLLVGVGQFINLSVSLVAIYFSFIALLWAAVIPLGRDPLLKTHGTTLLWLLCLVATAASLTHIIVLQPYLALVHYFAYSALALALTIAAFRAQSSLPIYVLMVVTAVVIIYARLYYGIHSHSGLIVGLSAMVIAAVKVLIQKYHIDQLSRQADQFFSKPFYVYNKTFLQLPLLHLLWLLTTASVVQSMAYFAPLVLAPDVALGMLIGFALVVLIAIQTQNKFVGYLAQVPLLMFAASIVISVINSWQALVVIAMLAGLQYGIIQVRKFGLVQWDAVFQPAFYSHSIMQKLSIPAGLAVYLVYFDHSFWMTLVYGVAALVYTHWALLLHGKYRVYHVVLAHIFITWSLVFVQVAPVSINAGYEILVLQQLQWIIGAVMCLFIPAYWLEIQHDQLWQNYVNACQYWLVTLAIIYFVTTLIAISSGVSQDMLIYFGLGILLLHIANRSWNHSILQYIKAITCVAMGYVLFDSLLWAMFFGLLLFSTIEWLLSKTNKMDLLRIQSRYTDRINMNTRLHSILHAFIIVCILVHLGLQFVFPSYEQNLNHYLLYTLIPFCLYLSRQLQFRYLSYLAIGVFAYTNIFISLPLLPYMQLLNLNIVHLINGSFVLSIIALVSINRVVVKRLAL